MTLLDAERDNAVDQLRLCADLLLGDRPASHTGAVILLDHLAETLLLHEANRRFRIDDQWVQQMIGPLYDAERRTRVRAAFAEKVRLLSEEPPRPHDAIGRVTAEWSHPELGGPPVLDTIDAGILLAGHRLRNALMHRGRTAPHAGLLGRVQAAAVARLLVTVIGPDDPQALAPLPGEPHRDPLATTLGPILEPLAVEHDELLVTLAEDVAMRAERVEFPGEAGDPRTDELLALNELALHVADGAPPPSGLRPLLKEYRDASKAERAAYLAMDPQGQLPVRRRMREIAARFGQVSTVERVTIETLQQLATTPGPDPDSSIAEILHWYAAKDELLDRAERMAEKAWAEVED